MTKLHLDRLFVGTISLLLACGSASAQPLVPGGFFRDDFEDGNSRDSQPAEWRRGVWDAEKDEVIDGDLHILGSRNSAVFAVDQDGSWLTYEDSSILAQMRMTGQGTGRGVVGVFARSPGPTSYFGGIDNYGQLFIGGPYPSNWDSTLDTDIDPVTSDVLMQLQLKGTEIDLTVWSEGDPKPATPQLSFVDDQLKSGAFGAFAVSLSGTPVDLAIRWIEITESPSVPLTGLQAGDADQNLVFDQRDLVHVLVAGKYLTAEAATWGEGDWNGAPGGAPGNPPPGDGFFNQQDIVAALASRRYLTGPYAAAPAGGLRDMNLVSVPEPTAFVLALVGLISCGAINGTFRLSRHWPRRS